MPFKLFGGNKAKKMSPAELGKLLNEAVHALEANQIIHKHSVLASTQARSDPDSYSNCNEKISQDVHFHLCSIMEMLDELSDASFDGVEPKGEKSPKSKGVEPTFGHVDSLTVDLQKSMFVEVEQLVDIVISTDALAGLIIHLGVLDFEVRKQVSMVFGRLLRLRELEGCRAKFVQHIGTNQALLKSLLKGYSVSAAALNCGLMIRDCASHSSIVKALLDLNCLSTLMNCVQNTSLDVSMDAFLTLRELLMTNPQLASQYVETHFDEFFGQFHGLLRSDDYVTMRQCLRLLGQILLCKGFSPVMLRYVNDETFLIMHMKLLQDKSDHIKFEAFHIFKMFVANPRKMPKIQRILYQNRDRLIRYIEKFKPAADYEKDAQFLHDRQTTLERIRKLEALAINTVSAASSFKSAAKTTAATTDSITNESVVSQPSPQIPRIKRVESRDELPPTESELPEKQDKTNSDESKGLSIGSLNSGEVKLAANECVVFNPPPRMAPKERTEL